MRSLLVLFAFCLLHFSGNAQTHDIRIILHFYGPLSAQRSGFEDSVMTFYDVYKTQFGEQFPAIGIVREDYSDVLYRQKFITSDPDDTNIRRRIKDIENESFRSKTKPHGSLALKRGVRKYSRTPELKPNHYFLGGTTNLSTNQYKSCLDLKKALIKDLKSDKKIGLIHIFMLPSFDNESNDADYDKRTLLFVSQDYSSSIYLSDSVKNVFSRYMEGYTNSINLGSLDSKIYVEHDKIRLRDSLEIPAVSLNDHYFKNTAFSKLHYIYKKGIIEYISAKPDLCEFSYWTEVECYRPDSNDYEFSLVKMKVGLGPKGKIVSMEELEVLGLFHADTSINPKRVIEDPMKRDVVVYSDNSIPPPPPLDSLRNELGTLISVEPQYIGGLDKLYKDIYANIVYPEAEAWANVQGTVYVSFVVEWNGSVSHVMVDFGVPNGPGLDKVASKAVSNLGFFRPAQMNGKTVRYRYRVPIKFTLK